jgi:hypothetical protein
VNESTRPRNHDDARRVALLGGEWDPDDTELGALMYIAQRALGAASVKAEKMSRHGRRGMLTRTVRKVDNSLNRLRSEVDGAWCSTRPSNESGPTPLYPIPERLPEWARVAIEALDGAR